MMRPGCKKPEGSLSSRPESDPAASRVRTKSVSDGGWGLSSSRATDRAWDEPVCLRCRWGRAHKSEMASDGEVVSGLNAPNWAGAMALRVCESATATGTDAAAGEGVAPRAIGHRSFCRNPRIRRPNCEWAVGSGQMPLLASMRSSRTLQLHETCVAKYTHESPS